MSALWRRWRMALTAYSATVAAEPAGPAEETPARWSRANYQGQPVDLRGGPALAGALALAAAEAGADPAVRAGAVAAVALAGAAGLLDDLAGDGSTRGLKGHFQRLKQGQITTGLVKLAAVGAGAVVFAASQGSSRVDVADAAPQRQSRRRRPHGRAARRSRGARRARPRSPAARLALAGVDATLVAGAANLANLLDLRPGRALKAAAAPAAALALAPGQGGQLAAGIVGAAAAAAPYDLGERTMLGDCGANALGAALGVAMVRSLPWPARLAAAASAVGLILASEKVSFSRVIATNPTLNRLDWLGRAAGPDAASRRAAPSRRATGAQPRDGRPVRSGGGLSTQPTRPRREPRR